MGRLTQRDIARLAGVSQTTVSLVLNRSDAAARISPETRERVLSTIDETGYVADPLARRLLSKHNQILGVFTYEPVFPSTGADFFAPFLQGIEQAAERLGCDLLLFTSAPVDQGHRRIFHENNRLRLADGCVLLGREIPRDELTKLVSGRYPFVSIGRRDDVDEPVPYVGVDYVAATKALVKKAKSLGHRRLGYVGTGAGVESSADRLRGFRQAAGRSHHEPTEGRSPGELLDGLLGAGVTVAFVEDSADAVRLAAAAAERGIAVPGELSLLALGSPTKPAPTEVEFTGFRIPRREVGGQAVELLDAILSGRSTRLQRLLPCELVDGTTLSPPPERKP